jgi:phosphoglycolate phosphatase-like HAD superfamily hydrolase
VGHLHRLIAFDLDGTLIDSRRDLTESANQLIEELGGQILTEEQIVGMGHSRRPAAASVRMRSNDFWRSTTSAC